MSNVERKTALLARRKRRVRKDISGTPERPRLTVYRSLQHIYAQIIDDISGTTLASASSLALKIPGSNMESAKKVGLALAEQAKGKSIEKVCFDRNGRLYHGCLKAFADAVREGGIQF
jgi:large subunit ribosomal protein L18